MSDTTVLRVEGLVKKYRKLTAVYGLTLRVEAGDLVGFIGPNGAGKSTTMGCIAGTLNPNAGTIHVGDVDVLADPITARKRTSFVPQHLELYDYLTGQEYLEFVADLRDLSGEDRDAQIAELLELCELTEARHRLVKEYSGGMARKIAIAAALLGPPQLLLLDESFVGLDPESTFRIQQRLARFCDEGGAILLSSHILDMLERLCTRIVMLQDGQLKLDLSQAELRARLDDPDDPDTTLTALYMRETGKLL